MPAVVGGAGVREGLSNEETALRLAISAETAKSHRGSCRSQGWISGNRRHGGNRRRRAVHMS